MVKDGKFERNKEKKRRINNVYNLYITKMIGKLYSTLLNYTLYLLHTKFCKLQQLNESRVIKNLSLFVGRDQHIVDTNVGLFPIIVWNLLKMSSCSKYVNYLVSEISPHHRTAQLKLKDFNGCPYMMAYLTAGI